MPCIWFLLLCCGFARGACANESPKGNKMAARHAVMAIAVACLFFCSSAWAGSRPVLAVHSSIDRIGMNDTIMASGNGTIEVLIDNAIVAKGYGTLEFNMGTLNAGVAPGTYLATVLDLSTNESSSERILLLPAIGMPVQPLMPAPQSSSAAYSQPHALAQLAFAGAAVAELLWR